MLKVFRDNLKYLSWVLWLVIAVFILFVFVDFGATVNTGAAPATAAAAVVGNKEISWGEFRTAHQNTERLYRQIYGDQFSPELAQQLGITQRVLNDLIADKIMLAEAERIGLAITDQELREAILSSPTFQGPDGAFVGEEAYSQTLRRNGLSVESWESSLRQQLLSQKVRTILSENLFVPESDVERAYRRQTEKAKIRFVHVTGDDLEQELVLVDSDIEAYFLENQEAFRTPERRVVDSLLIDRLQIQNSLVVGEDEVNAYYDENQADFRRAEQVRARHILLKVDANRDDATARSELEAVRRRIESGEDFAGLAVELSEDPGSAPRGGDLGSFGRDQMVKPFEDAAFGAAAGEMVGPVKTNFGYHLIEVLEHQSEGLELLAAAAPRIRQRLLAERSAAAAESKARDLADRIDREGIAVDGWAGLAAEEIGVRVETSEPFGRADAVSGIGRSTDFSVQAFELEPGSVSSPIAIGSGWAILAVKEIQPPSLPQLNEVRAEVESQLREKRVIEAAVFRARRAFAELETGRSFEEVVASLGKEPEETTLFDSRGPVGTLGANAAVTTSALALSTGDFGGPIETEDGAVVFEVLEREHFEATKFEDEKAATLASLKAQRTQELVDTLVEKRRNELKIELDPGLLQNFDLPTTTTSS